MAASLPMQSLTFNWAATHRLQLRFLQEDGAAAAAIATQRLAENAGVSKRRLHKVHSAHGCDRHRCVSTTKCNWTHQKHKPPQEYTQTKRSETPSSIEKTTTAYRDRIPVPRQLHGRLFHTLGDRSEHTRRLFQILHDGSDRIPPPGRAGDTCEWHSWRWKRTFGDISEPKGSIKLGVVRVGFIRKWKKLN